MTYAAQQICEAAAALLKAAPVTWGLVLETRLPTARAVMPYLLVFGATTPASPVTASAPMVLERNLSLVVAGRLRLPGNNDTETVEDRMYALASEVESTLTFAALQAVIPQLQQLYPVEVDPVVVLNAEDAPQHAEITLTFAVRYLTQEGAPDVLL